MDAIYNVFRCKIKLFPGVFSLNYVMISTNNTKHNENPASTGSLAGSKRIFSTFHLSSTRTNQRTCCEPATCRDWCSRFATTFSTKKVESVSKACRKPARTCRKPGCKPGRKPGLQPGLQLARIMECGLYTVILAVKSIKQPTQRPYIKI